MPSDQAAPHRREEPLNRPARLCLAFLAVGVILLAYTFAFTCITLLAAVLLFEFGLVLGAARVGLASIPAAMLERHIALTAAFVRCIRLPRGPGLGFSLERGDAPRLFDIVENLCNKLHISVPSVIWINNGVNAYVELKGMRRGSGRTILGVGYDLLAGLNLTEMEAVLAHEMAHSKLVQRGLSKWLMGGLQRLGYLHSGLFRYTDDRARRGRKSDLSEFLLWATNHLTSLAARLVALYSRQDEFDADRTAASICGAAAMRSSLLKLRPLTEISNRLLWRERVAQLQSSGALSQWLLAELGRVSTFTSTSNRGDVFNEFSTHPALSDRLAALGPAVDLAPQQEPAALTLLTDPDNVAGKLVQQLQSVVKDQEQKDSRELKQFARKLAAGQTELRPLRLFAIAAIVLGAIMALAAVVTQEVLVAVFAAAPLLVVGFVLMRWTRYKEKTPLPAPDYAAMVSWSPGANAQAQADAAEAEVRKAVAVQSRARDRKRVAIDLCYSALGRCDYAAAHGCARYILQQIDKKSTEALTAMSIAAAAFGDYQTSGAAYSALQKKSGFRTSSSAWAAGWTLALAGEWTQAEALLQKAAALREGDPTVLSLLALAQSRRGKLHSAIENARKACSAKPGKNEHARQLTMLLLDAGFVREAQPRLMAVQQDAAYDSDLALAMVRLHLMLGKTDQAERWTNTVAGFAGRPDLLLRLGEAYELARNIEAACGFYRQALTGAFYPEACAAIGRIEAQRGNRVDAERYLLAALDTGRTVGEKGLGALACLPNTLGALNELEQPVNGCRAWLAAMPQDTPLPALAGRSVLVYAPSQAQAQHHLDKVLMAMDRRLDSNLSSRVRWRRAGRAYQPDGPVYAGVQCIMS